MRTIRYLGAAVIALGCAQLVFYVVWSRRPALEFFYFDPRIGFLFFEDLLGIPETNRPTLVHWMSAFSEIILGVIVLVKPRLVGVYLLSEIIFALPSIMFFAI